MSKSTVFQRFGSFSRLAMVVLFLGSMALATGCKSMGGSSTSSAAPSKAVLITAGNGTTYVLYPSSDGKDVQMMSTSGKPVGTMCAQCKADAIKAFNGESIPPVCDKCGATRTLLSVPPAQ